MSKRKAIYTGLFISPSETTKQQLLETVSKYAGTILPNLKLDHLTLKFHPPPSEVQALRLSGKKEILEFEAIGVAADSKAQAVFCVLPKLPEGVVCENYYPHITVAVADDIQPIYSNELLKRHIISFSNPIILNGCLGFFDGKNICFNYKGTIYDSLVQEIN